MKSIGERAFLGCSSLTSINIPNSITDIEKYTFGNCTSLESVVIGEGVNYISQSAFHGAKKIKSITLGSKVSCISNDNFFNCEDLEVVTCKALSVPTISPGTGDDFLSAFSNCHIEYAKLIVPDKAIEAYKKVYPWNMFGTIEGLSGSKGGK